MSQELEQLIFVNPGMNRRTNSSGEKGCAMNKCLSLVRM